MRAAAWLVAALLAAIAVATPASAQRGGRAGDFDFYVLALSWSPTYCADRGERAEQTQCGLGKSYGFVTHGLWPQYERGFPSDCYVTGRNPTRAQVDGLLDIMPSSGLVRYQWRKHGACSGLDPASYFGLIRSAWDKVAIPPDLKSASQERELSPGDIEKAFIEANPGMKPAGIAVACPSGDLQEVRVCLTKSLDFRPCAEVDRRSCRASKVSVPAAGGR